MEYFYVGVSQMEEMKQSGATPLGQGTLDGVGRSHIGPTKPSNLAMIHVTHSQSIINH